MASSTGPASGPRSVLEPFIQLVTPPVGGVTGDNAASIQRAFNSKDILPVSYGIMAQASKEWQLRDAAGGQFLVLEHRPKQTVLHGSGCYIVVIADHRGKIVVRGIKHPTLVKLVHWAYTDMVEFSGLDGACKSVGKLDGFDMAVAMDPSIKRWREK